MYLRSDVKIDLSEEKVLSSSDVFEVLFDNKKTQNASRLFAKWLDSKGGRASKAEVSKFADQLQTGEIMINEVPFKYSRRNFYITVLRKLVGMGFLQRNVPVWDEKSKKTSYVYLSNTFDIPKKPPSVGFWRISYFICRKWNQTFTR